jgi:hypothetical protein
MAQVERLANGERSATVALIAHLAELDARRLYRGAGFTSTFAYCTEVLRLSEGGAYNRIEAARAARKFPRVLDLLEQGALNVTTARILAPHLTAGNHEALLAAAAYKSKRQVEEVVAQVFPRPDVAPSVRKMPSPSIPSPALSLTPAPAALPSSNPPPDALMPLAALLAAPPVTPRHPVVSPLAPDRYQIRFTGSAATCEKLRLAQDLLRHAVPSGDPAEIFDRALTALLADLTRKKFAATKLPRGSRGQRPASRNIPAVVKRAVVARDRGRCAFVARNGRRCGERAFVEFHHVVPYAMGGSATAENIQLRCRTHNGYEAEMCFGRRQPHGRVGAELAPGRVLRRGTSPPMDTLEGR